MADKTFRKMRGIDDKSLNAALVNHASVLRGLAQATTMLLRERRLLLVWNLVVTVAVGLLLSGVTGANILVYVQGVMLARW